jgi:xanthine dehydrogenase accessory factor
VKDIIETLERWTTSGTTVALGSVVERIGSAPRDPGATLAVAADGEVVGGVTGGCVEPEVIREANEVLAGGRGALRFFGLDDEDGFDVGLTCGGRIAVAIYRLDPALVAPVAEAVRADRPIAVTLRLDEARFGEQAIVEGNAQANGDAVANAARSLLELGESGIIETESGEKVFVETYAPRPDLYLFGASDHVAALVPLGKQIGYRVTVCDPRTVFLTRERFPDADVLSGEWPDEFLAHAPIDARTAICMMTHDLKFDVPALKLALSSPAGFIGAIGSEKTRADRLVRLHELGVTDEEIARLHAPVGIAIGARTPDEVAVSIAAQLIEHGAAARSGRIADLVPATVLA